PPGGCWRAVEQPSHLHRALHLLRLLHASECEGELLGREALELLMTAVVVRIECARMPCPDARRVQGASASGVRKDSRGKGDGQHSVPPATARCCTVAGTGGPRRWRETSRTPMASP